MQKSLRSLAPSERRANRDRTLKLLRNKECLCPDDRDDSVVQPSHKEVQVWRALGELSAKSGRREFRKTTGAELRSLKKLTAPNATAARRRGQRNAQQQR